MRLKTDVAIPEHKKVYDKKIDDLFPKNFKRSDT